MDPLLSTPILRHDISRQHKVVAKSTVMRVPEADSKISYPAEVVITCSEVLGSELPTYISSIADTGYIATTHSYKSDTVSLPDVKFTPS